MNEQTLEQSFSGMQDENLRLNSEAGGEHSHSQYLSGSDPVIAAPAAAQPEEYPWPPGFAGRLASFIYYNSYLSIPEVAISATLGVLAGVYDIRVICTSPTKSSSTRETMGRPLIERSRYTVQIRKLRDDDYGAVVQQVEGRPRSSKCTSGMSGADVTVRACRPGYTRIKKFQTRKEGIRRLSTFVHLLH